MMRMAKPRHMTLTAFLALLALAACRADQEEVQAESSPAAIETSVIPPMPTESIMRADMGAPETVEPSLEPLEVTISFPEGGAKLGPAALERIEAILNSAQYRENGRIILRGHTDSVGDDAVNLRTSRRRAQAVAEALAAGGADPARLEIIALGEMRPVAPNAHLDGSPDEEGRARNRRVDVVVMVGNGEGAGQRGDGSADGTDGGASNPAE